jgi:hypothetical protein
MKSLAAIVLFLLASLVVVLSAFGQTVPPPFPITWQTADYWTERKDMLVLAPKPLQQWITPNAPYDTQWYLMEVVNAKGVASQLLWHSAKAPVVATSWTSADGKLTGKVTKFTGPWPLQNAIQNNPGRSFFLFSDSPTTYLTGGDGVGKVFLGWYGTTTEYYWCRNP